MNDPLSRKKYNLWLMFFFVAIFGMVGSFVLATSKIDYTWRWYQVPTYFIHHETVEITSEVEGTVDRIETKGKTTTVYIKSDDGSEVAYDTSKGKIQVDEGDFIFPGDILATYKEWRPGLLLLGLLMTLKVSLYAIAIGVVIGIVGGVARISANPALSWFSYTYVELIRGTPLLVQIFIWYYIGSTLVNQILTRYNLFEISAIWYGVIALAVFTGAYVTEIVRSGIQSINRGQSEAGRSLGMTHFQTLRHIILPQALRRILPPLAGQFISLIKDSSLLGIIAIRELTKATREAVTTSFASFELFFTCAFLYLLLTFTLSLFVQYLERRMATQ
ncbi:MAG: amino acid ABC transporter permease [Deltaproteobacteria bacterium]|nr:MAG: amino acid ABC transporter permease [Deltaproteobacteria bacterium]